MASTDKYINIKGDKYSATFSKETTDMLKMYCRTNDINMQKFCESVMFELMTRKFEKLREECTPEQILMDMEG